MFWYEENIALYENEVKEMNRQFPQFELKKLSDGRLCWIGTVKLEYVRENAEWTLQLVYDYNHPTNSVNVYIVAPNLRKAIEIFGEIPHLSSCSSGEFQICMSRHGSAVSCLSLANIWIVVFELWMAGDVSTTEFLGYRF